MFFISRNFLVICLSLQRKVFLESVLSGTGKIGLAQFGSSDWGPERDPGRRSLDRPNSRRPTSPYVPSIGRAWLLDPVKEASGMRNYASGSTYHHRVSEEWPPRLTASRYRQPKERVLHARGAV